MSESSAFSSAATTERESRASTHFFLLKTPKPRAKVRNRKRNLVRFITYQLQPRKDARKEKSESWCNLEEPKLKNWSSLQLLNSKGKEVKKIL